MIKRYAASVSLLVGMAAGSACAQTDLGTHTLTITAELMTPNCSLAFPNGDSADLGTLTSRRVKTAPSAIDASALTYIRTASAFGDLVGPYTSDRAPITVRISCLDNPGYVLNSYARYGLQFGDSRQMLTGNVPGAATSGYLFSLNTGGAATRRNFGFALFVKDSRAYSFGGKNGLVKPGETIALIDGRSFYQNAGAGAYYADFEVSPGFFLGNLTRDVDGGNFSTELVVTLKFN